MGSGPELPFFRNSPSLIEPTGTPLLFQTLVTKTGQDRLEQAKPIAVRQSAACRPSPGSLLTNSLRVSWFAPSFLGSFLSYFTLFPLIQLQSLLPQASFLPQLVVWSVVPSSFAFSPSFDASVEFFLAALFSVLFFIRSALHPFTSRLFRPGYPPAFITTHHSVSLSPLPVCVRLSGMGMLPHRRVAGCLHDMERMAWERATPLECGNSNKATLLFASPNSYSPVSSISVVCAIAVSTNGFVCPQTRF